MLFPRELERPNALLSHSTVLVNLSFAGGFIFGPPTPRQKRPAMFRLSVPLIHVMNAFPHQPRVSPTSIDETKKSNFEKKKKTSDHKEITSEKKHQHVHISVTVHAPQPPLPPPRPPPTPPRLPLPANCLFLHVPVRFAIKMRPKVPPAPPHFVYPRAAASAAAAASID